MEIYQPCYTYVYKEKAPCGAFSYLPIPGLDSLIRRMKG
jgi:hypothetical protein